MAQLITNLPVGSKVKFGKYSVESELAEDIIWQIADKNHPGYPSNSITLLTDKIIDQRGFDAKEPSNADSNRRSYGNNRYLHSNLRQWLNKGGASWYAATHGTDEPPTNAGTNDYGTGYDDKEGFLDSFNSDELGVMLDTTLTVAKNTVTDGGGSETVVDKVFLLSNTEVGLANENSIVEGSLMPIFSSDADRISKLTEQAFNNGLSTNKPASANDPWYWWLRTPSAGNSNSVRNVFTSGTLNNYNAFYGHYGVRPALNVQSDIFVSDTADSDGAYTVVYNESPAINIIQKTYPDITFETSDNDGTIESVRVLINDLEKQTYTNIEATSTMAYKILYSDLNEGANTLKIEATDDKGAVSTKTLNIQKDSIPTPLVGSEITIKGIRYAISGVVDNTENLTLSLSSPLENNLSIGESVEMLDNYIVPHANLGSGELAATHIKSSLVGSDILEEFESVQDGRELQIRLELNKSTSGTLELKEPKAILSYKSD